MSKDKNVASEYVQVQNMMTSNDESNMDKSHEEEEDYRG